MKLIMFFLQFHQNIAKLFSSSFHSSIHQLRVNCKQFGDFTNIFFIALIKLIYKREDIDHNDIEYFWHSTLKVNEVFSLISLQMLLAFLECSDGVVLVLVSVRVPFLHDGVVEVLVGKEARAEHHCEANSEDGPHHAAVYDGVDTLPPLPLLLLAVLILILGVGEIQ